LPHRSRRHRHLQRCRELEQGFQGAAHAGRPLLLEGGLDWKSMSLTPKDMDFIDAEHRFAMTRPSTPPPARSRWRWACRRVPHVFFTRQIRDIATRTNPR